MIRSNFCTLALLALAMLLGTPRTAHAAQSYDNCTGFITSLPAVITVPGTWCLKKDLATAITSGNAIDIQTDDVTIDCNDFKLGGLAAGSGTLTTGISSDARSSIAVRRCNIRGFSTGIGFFAPVPNAMAMHTIEDNRLDGNTYRGLVAPGNGTVVRRNLISNTGGSTSTGGSAFAIVASHTNDIVDNTVSGVVATSGTNGNAVAIFDSNNFGGSISGNRVRGLLSAGTGIAIGIKFLSITGRASLRENVLSGNSSANSVGVSCTTTYQYLIHNTISGFGTAFEFCGDDGGNLIAP